MLCSDNTTVCPGDMLSFESRSRQIFGKICEELALNPGEKRFFRRVLDRSSARPFFAAHPNVAGKHGSLPANQQHGWELQTAGKVVQYKVFPSLFFHLACIGVFVVRIDWAQRHDDQNSNNSHGEVLPERVWTFKHDFRFWCKEESMWCKREKLEQLINFVFVKF